jgi:short-subunit dehydrogenase
MLERRSGRISAISSLSAYLPLPRALAYPASKAGLNVLLDSLRIDLRGRGVGITVVNPGFVDTPMTAKNKHKMPFLVDAGKAARIIVDGCLRGKRVVEFPLPLVAIVKASKSLLPGPVYDWLVHGRGM